MSKIKFVTDSTAYIPKDLISKYNLDVAQLSVSFQNAVNDEGFPGEFDTFFEKLANSKDFPTTSQPSMGKFVEIFQNAIDDGYEVIAITISSRLSGTFNSAVAAANIVDPSKISVIDSYTVAANLKALVEIGLSLSEKGLSREDIVETIEKQKDKTSIRITVSDLEYLKRGGRLSSAGAAIGSLLNIRPIIGLIDGKLESIEKIRGKKKAMEKMISDIPQSTTTIGVCHIGILDEATEYQELIQSRYPKAKVELFELGPVIGCHLGPASIGICYLYE